jgi:hypothetical protein
MEAGNGKTEAKQESGGANSSYYQERAGESFLEAIELRNVKAVW